MGFDKMDLKHIEELLILMKTYGADSIKIEEEDQKVCIHMTPRQTVTQGLPSAGPGSYTASTGEAAGAEDGAEDGGHAVTSPTVGVFYEAPGPEEPPYVQAGDRVEPETIVCIIESMKVMNEIPAGVAGIVTEIFPVNGDRVEFEQKLMTIRADQ